MHCFAAAMAASNAASIFCMRAVFTFFVTSFMPAAAASISFNVFAST